MEYPTRFCQVGFSFLLLLTGCITLKDVKIYVPKAVIRGHEAILNCTYDLEGDDLYSVKWYRGGREFFRYTPNDKPSFKQFKIIGLNVNEKDSTATQLVLEHVPKEIGGLFSCEVTADQPSFFTDIKVSYLEVVDLPKKDPFISGLRSRYRLGETLRANCTSEMSYPATNLSWFVNGSPVDVSKIHKHKRPTPDGHYQSSDLILRLPITKQLFSNGRLKIRCVAILHDVYYRSSEKTVELEKKRHKASYAHIIPTPPTTTMFMQWEMAQTAQRHPDTTLVFESTSRDTAGRASTLRCSSILGVAIALFYAIHVR